MMTLRTAITWLVANPALVLDFLVKLGALLSLFVAVLPQRAQRWPWIGPAIAFLARVSVLTHRDEPGTLKWPGVLTAVVAALDKAEAGPTLAVTPPASPAPSIAPAPEPEGTPTITPPAPVSVQAPVVPGKP